MKSRSRPRKAASTDDAQGDSNPTERPFALAGVEPVSLEAGLLRARELRARVWLKVTVSGWVRVYAQLRRGRRAAGRPHYRAAPCVEFDRLPELLGAVLDVIEAEAAAS